jgi:eukaryotic-like serine/threonine-protein kinase
VSLSPDGSLLLFQDGQGGAQASDLMALRVGAPPRAAGAALPSAGSSTTTADVRPLVKTADGEANGMISPDGRWLAYQSNEAGTWDIYVRPLRDLDRGARFTVSTAGGTQPRWALDGRELFYLSTRNEMMSVKVGMSENWSVTTPVKLFDASPYFVGGTANPFFNYDVAREGRFLMIKLGGPANEGSPATIVVVQHWFEEVKRLVPR